MKRIRPRRRSWLFGMLAGVAALAFLIRRRLEPVDSAPLLPSPPPPPSEPPRIVLPAAIIESADSIPETTGQPVPAEPELETEPDLFVEAEPPLLEREVGASFSYAAPSQPVETAPATQPATAPETQQDQSTETQDQAAGTQDQAAGAETQDQAEHDHEHDDDDHTGQTGYCVSCRAKREIVDGHEETTENGRRAMRGTCPVCGNTIFRFLPNKES